MKTRTKVIIGIFAGIIILFAMLPILAIKWNGVPLFVEPGLFKRLGTYLTTNVAETRDDHDFPELQTPKFDVPANELWDGVKQTIQSLGWDVELVDEVVMEVHAVITTPMMQYKDDIVVRVNSESEGRCGLYIRSSSRVGKGDLGQNAESVRMLIDDIKRQLELNY